MGGLHGSLQSPWLSVGLYGRSLWVSTVSVGGLHGSLQVSTISVGLHRRSLDLIEIIQFCLKIYDLLRHPHLWVGKWVGKWVGSGQMTNLIKLELFDII